MDDEQKQLLEELLFSGAKKLSFARMLFFGGFHVPTVLPFPRPSELIEAETEAIVARVNAFATSAIDARAIDSRAEIPDHVIRGLGEIGLLGLTVPKAYGGLGLSQYTYCQAVSALACHCSSSALFVNAHQSIGLKALVLFGTEAQRTTWLPGLARGERIAAFSLTEKNAGSDASAVETRAVYVPEKRVYRLNGEKQWTTNGSIASVLTVMAQTSVHTPTGPIDKITAFLVTPDMPGFQIKDKALDKVGMRGTWTANLRFKDMEVPEDSILGTKGAGLKICLTVLDYGRTTFGASCAGPARMLVQRAIDHARNRIQFRRPLASFPLVKQKIARMAALAYAMEATTWLTAGLVDRGLEEFMIEAAILKVFASESLWTMIYETMQIYGGRSFFTTEPLERMMRDARLNTIGEGANEVLRAFIAAVGLRDLGLQLQGFKDVIRHPMRDFGRLRGFGYQCFNYLWTPDIPVQNALITREARELGRRVRRLFIASTRLLIRYREEVIEQQLALDRIATIVIALYTATATISRIDAELSAQGDPNRLQDHLHAARCYCHMAFRSIDEAMNRLFDPQDRLIESTADRLTKMYQE